MTSRRRFTDDEVRAIRQSPLSARELAAQHDVSHPTILNIRDRRTYKNVPDYLGLDLIRPEVGGQYVLEDPIAFLRTLPDGCCGTAVTAPRIRHRPYIIGGSSGWTVDDERAAQDEYVDVQRRVIEECLRVVGPEGVLLYLHRFDISARRSMDTRHDIISGFPLRQIIIWNHQMRILRFSRRWVNRVPNNYGVIFVFSGPRWTIPDESRPKAMGWGDVWNIPPGPGDLSGTGYYLRERNYYDLPAELADRCIAFGSGTVVNPFAASGAMPLAAIRAGRNWLACDTDPFFLDAFEARRAMMGSASGDP